MKLLITSLTLVLAGVTSLSAQSPAVGPELQSRIPEAIKACEDYVLKVSKYPDSITFDNPTYLPAGKHELEILIYGWGRYPSGGILRTRYGCTEKCKKGSVCQVSLLDDLTTRLPEAVDACKASVMQNAKNPNSVQFDGSYESSPDARKESILVLIPGWGMNSYGATLRTKFSCLETCKRDIACVVTLQSEL
jgi:hypothetical protein